MKRNIRRWMAGAFLLGGLACLGAPGAQAGYQNYPRDRRDDDRRERDNDRRDDRYERDRRAGTWGDYRNDRDFQRQIRSLEERIHRDTLALREDSRRFGKNSFQARAAKERLKRDERELKQLKKELKRYNKLNKHRDDRGRFRY